MPQQTFCQIDTLYFLVASESLISRHSQARSKKTQGNAFSIIQKVGISAKRATLCLLKKKEQVSATFLLSEFARYGYRNVNEKPIANSMLIVPKEEFSPSFEQKIKPAFRAFT